MSKTTISWKGKMTFEGSSESGHTVLMDAKTEAGGDDRGPRPMEMVLVALGGCTGMDVVSILNKMRVPYERFEIDIEAERAPQHPKVYTQITVVYKIWGNVPADKFTRAVELSKEKYCSVTHMLKSTAEMKYALEINGERLPSS